MQKPLALTLLIALILVSCGAPAAGPTATVPASTPTTVAEATATATMEPTEESSLAPGSATLENSLALMPAGEVNAYPGPRHYVGDVLTLEVPLEQYAEASEASATLTVDGGAPVTLSGRWNFNLLQLPQALDTSGLGEGEHELRIQAEGPNESIDVDYAFNLLPAEQRPAQEADAEWLMTSSDCCTIHYLSNSAAARDIEEIAAASDVALGQIEDEIGADLDASLEIWLLDRMWGNGAFGGNGELAVVYGDRDYGPAQGDIGLLTLFRHEFTHAADLDYSPIHDQNSYFAEGLAVYLAGGHYKPEPLDARSAAMEELGYGSGLDQLGLANHEIAYLQGASVVAYVVDDFGWDAMWAFRDAASFDSWFDGAQRDIITQDVFGLSYGEFSASYEAWVDEQEPGEQLEDLRLTIELQELRRDYQERFLPEPMALFGASDQSFARPENISIAMRESSQPANMALELMIANGQQAIMDGRYEDAQALVDAVASVLESRDFSNPLASYYASAVEALAAEGYLVYDLSFDGNQAAVIVSQEAPELIELQLDLVDGDWQIGN